jgi:asparaginyl-tRNA synthetase
MEVAESYLKFCLNYALENNREDLEFLEKQEKGLIERLKNVVNNDFQRLTYTDAIKIVEEASNKNKKLFEVKPYWGLDMGSEHERYITEKVYKKPVIVYNYPKEIKAFYMRQNDDGKTVAAMDILVPKIGEIIGGSQREERLEVLEARIKELGMPIENYWWYLELRKFGSIPHCGFGLGFERLMMMVTGLENIRDVIPYPRYPGHAEF